MRKLLFLLLFLTPLFLIAQNTTKIISGHIFLDSIAIQDVHIINKKLDIGAVSNKNGVFEILASKGDILIISHLNFEYKEHIITDVDFNSANVTIYLHSKTYMLDEIVLQKKKGIFDIDKDILLHNAPIVNAKTLNLPYSNSQKPKKEGTVKIASGVAVNLTGLINGFNGKAKLQKALQKTKIEDQNLLEIRKHFTDGFFVYQLKIKKEHINSFLEHCIAKGIIRLYHKHKLLELTTVLLDNSKNSPYLMDKENSSITQK